MLGAGMWDVFGTAGEYTETVTGGNAVNTGATKNFTYITGSNFAEVTPADSLTFAASQCALTAQKAGRYSIRLFASLFLVTGTGYAYLSGAIDVNGDIEGEDASTISGKVAAAIMTAGGVNSSYGFVSLERVGELSPGDVVRACFAALNNTGAAPIDDMSVDHLVLTATPVPVR